jgi:hypothetical protein
VGDGSGDDIPESAIAVDRKPIVRRFVDEAVDGDLDPACEDASSPASHSTSVQP